MYLLLNFSPKCTIRKMPHFSFIRQSFAVIWSLKWFKVTFETVIIVYFLWGKEGRVFNLLVNTTAFKLIDKNFKTWLKISSQN